jgi:chromosome segregation ATPase
MDEETTLLLAKQEAAEKIGNQKRKLAEERELLARREKAKAQAAATLSELQSKRARISKDTEGARKRAENLRRRIAGIEARNADALKDGEPC